MVVELLYAFAMGNERIFDFADELLGAKKIRNAQADFAKGLFKGVVAHLQHIDSVIKAHLKSWELSRLGVIDKCILRLGVYEILKGEIDAPVAINEAIEIAKILGAENTGRFVNGVLDAINKQNLSNGGNLSWGMQFRTCKNFWDSADYQSSVRPKNSHKYKSHTAITSIVDSAESQNLGENPGISHEVRKSFCYFWLLPKVESPLPYQLKTTKRDNFVEYFAESTLDSTIPQNPHDSADSALDSANSQNLTRKMQNPRIQHEMRKSFCYFWLLPKVESSPPLNFNLPNDADSAKQNLIQNNCALAPENSPVSWCKKSGTKGAVVPPADFLLETDKRGSPPKSEDGCFLGTHLKVVGGSVGGVQPFLRKESSEFKGEGIADSAKDSAKLPFWVDWSR